MIYEGEFKKAETNTRLTGEKRKGVKRREKARKIPDQIEKTRENHL